MKRLQSQWANTIISLAGGASVAVLKGQWEAAIEYATSYYDALNEIRMVTLKTETEAAKIGQDMRDLAKEMKVTSTDLSKAAITFYRQGLSDSEVQDRLKWVTEYAKIANIAFDNAAQLMTAAINTMGQSIEDEGFGNVVEHVADVFLYLGDAAATSGEEIGKAMQKASASATEFGLSFEWLGAYIATVSEQTRQAPESIGNAFNTMLARMHQIKQTGFNTEDATKLNDVAKALAEINVELLDSEGQWRDMDEIYSDVAEKWGDLDAKTKGYLATTMAGTRQQNVFYALMNDLSKGIENGSRAWTLYKGAMEAAGTASEKFSIYQESIQASQANMTASLEQLYSNLQPNLIKGFYDMITLLVGGLNNLGGAIPIVVSGITALVTVIMVAKTAFAATHPIISLLAGAIAALASLGVMGGIGAITGDLTGMFKSPLQQYEEAVQQITETQNKIVSLGTAKSGLEEMLAKVQSGAQLTTEEINKYSSALNTVASISPTAEQAVRNFTSGVGDQETALEGLIAKTQEQINSYLLLEAAQARLALSNFQNSEEYNKAAQYTEGYYTGPQGEFFYNQGELKEYLDTFNLDSLSSNYWDEVEAGIENFFAAYQSVVTKATNDQTQKAIDNIISALGMTLSAGQREYLGEIILKMIMGDDGELDYEDVAQERISSMTNVLINGAKSAIEDAHRQMAYFTYKIRTEYGLEAGLYSWGEEVIDAQASELVYSLLKMGTSVEQVEEAYGNSENLSDFIDKLNELQNTVKKTNDSMTGEGGEESTEDAVKTYTDNIAKISKEIDKIKSLSESATKGESLNMADLLDIAEAHPEIMNFVDDIDLLKKKLGELQSSEEEAMKTSLRDMILNSKEIFKNSYLAGASSAGYSTLGEVQQFFQMQTDSGIVDYTQNLASLDAWINKLIDSFLGLTNAAGQAEQPIMALDQLVKDMQTADSLEDALKVFDGLENYDGTKVLQAITTIRDALKEAGVEMGEAPNAETNSEAFAGWLANAKEQAQQLIDAARQAASAYGILTEEELKSAQAAEEARKAREDYLKSMQELSQSIADEVDANKASLNGYADQIESLQTALDRGDVQGAANQWKRFNDAIKSGLQKNYPQLAKVLADISTQEGNASKNTQKLTKELKNAQKVATAKYFKDTAKAMYDVENGTTSLADALSTFHKEEANVIEAQLEYIDVSQKFADKTEVTTSEVSALAEVLGWTPQALLDNWDVVEPLLDGVKSSMEDLRGQFQEALWLNIVGSSDVDFSDVMNGLLAVQDAADATVQALLATGEFEIEEKELEEGMRYFAIDSMFPFRGHWETTSAKSTVSVLKPKGAPGVKTRGGGGSGKSGGGGGGGGGKTQTESEATKTLNRMQEAYDLQKHLIDIYSAQADYYSETGELQGVILYYEKQSEAIEKLNDSIEKNMGELKP